MTMRTHPGLHMELFEAIEDGLRTYSLLDGHFSDGLEGIFLEIVLEAAEKCRGKNFTIANPGLLLEVIPSL